ncbi:MAG: septal ring lytic transglycosylase RlpA family protein, partial [Treponema sp.]|nr:septal ring lytic transglycosylase RlpA family protein [Treponema sp.]
MKRVILILLCETLVCTLALAQVSGFNQRGKATREMSVNGLYIAHPSLPINSTATVTNTTNGKQVDATVYNRIPASSIRIADLSAAVW